ncbi:MAG: hypothetical protein FJZ01_12745 [Candidatus Sericytochromatia bacterium]|nr:hypothetical protein [Candidatus Tanganyikabacteria bacterium]
MSTIQIALPGRDDWKTVAVFTSDAKGIYLGRAGAVGDAGSLVLIRIRRDGKEFRMVARHTDVLGRYDFLAPVASPARKSAAA